MEEFRRRKIEIVQRYDEAFASLPQIALLRRNLSETFPFSYVLRVLDGSRDLLRDFLADHDIGSAVQFVPNHLQPFFEQYGGDLPCTEQLFGEVINLPCYTRLTDQELDRVISVVRSFFDGTSAE